MLFFWRPSSTFCPQRTPPIQADNADDADNTDNADNAGNAGNADEADEADDAVFFWRLS